MKRLTAKATALALILGAAPALAEMPSVGGAGQVGTTGAAGTAAGTMDTTGDVNGAIKMGDPIETEADVTTQTGADLTADGDFSGAATTPTTLAAEAQFEQKTEFEAWSEARMDELREFYNDSEEWTEEAAAEARADFNSALDDAEAAMADVKIATETQWEDARDSMVDAIVELETMRSKHGS